jgi:hypothetical protein
MGAAAERVRHQPYLADVKQGTPAIMDLSQVRNCRHPLLQDVAHSAFKVVNPNQLGRGGRNMLKAIGRLDNAATNSGTREPACPQCPSSQSLTYHATARRYLD